METVMKAPGKAVLSAWLLRGTDPLRPDAPQSLHVPARLSRAHGLRSRYDS
jgi:hypothetical protein